MFSNTTARNSAITLLVIAGVVAGWVALSAPSRSSGQPSEATVASAQAAAEHIAVSAKTETAATATQKLNQRRTELLKDYLDRRSEQTNFEELRKVVIMTSVACNGCPEKIIASLESLFEQSAHNPDHYLIITTPENNLPNFPCATIVDSEYEIERYNFESAGGCAIVDLNNGEIGKCQSVNVNKKEELLASLN